MRLQIEGSVKRVSVEVTVRVVLLQDGFLLHILIKCEEAIMELSLSECDIRLIIQKEGGLTSQCWSSSSTPESCSQVRGEIEQEPARQTGCG